MCLLTSIAQTTSLSTTSLGSKLSKTHTHLGNTSLRARLLTNFHSNPVSLADFPANENPSTDKLSRAINYCLPDSLHQMGYKHPPQSIIVGFCLFQNMAISGSPKYFKMSEKAKLWGEQFCCFARGAVFQSISTNEFTSLLPSHKAVTLFQFCWIIP